MNPFKTAVAIAVGTLFAGAAFAQSNYSIEQRDQFLDHRIERGVQNGQITGREEVRLESEQARIERLEARARADGHMSRNERARIDSAQDRLSRDIYRQSHDRQTANNNGHSYGRPHGWDRGNGNGWGRGNDNGNHWGRGNDNGNRWGGGQSYNNDHGRFDHRDGVRGEHNGPRGHAMTPSTGTTPGTGATAGTGTTQGAGREGRGGWTGRTGSRQPQVALAQTRPTTGGTRGGDNGRRTRQ